MAQDNTLARSLHDLDLAAWFGGSLMGAVGLNAAAAEVDQPAQRLRVATPAGRAGPSQPRWDRRLPGRRRGAGGRQRAAWRPSARRAGATVAKATVTGLALAATA